MAGQPEILVFRGNETAPYIQTLGQMRMDIFREYPYLYEGAQENENKYLQPFSNCKDSILVVAKCNDKVIGLISGMPLDQEADEEKEPFIQKGYATKEYYYLQEIVIKKEYRGQGLGKRMLEKFENSIPEIFKYIALCCVDRGETHPKKPANYLDAQLFFTRSGYTKRKDLIAYFTWPDIGNKVATEKPMIFWVKDRASL